MYTIDERKLHHKLGKKTCVFFFSYADSILNNYQHDMWTKTCWHLEKKSVGFSFLWKNCQNQLEPNVCADND